MIFHLYLWRTLQWVIEIVHDFLSNSFFNDFFSLKIGVIIDHGYLGNKYEKTFELLKEIIERVIREDLRGAGLNVKYFSWSKINFNKGKNYSVKNIFLLFFESNSNN